MIPGEFIPGVDKGIREQLKSGPLAGYPVMDLGVRLHFGSYHDVDSSELAFKIAASLAFKAGFMKANPVLLEPIMKVEVESPEDYMGDVIGDLNRRRGLIEGMEDGPSGQDRTCAGAAGRNVRLRRLLRSATQGRASYAMEFAKYHDAPTNVAQAVIEERKYPSNLRFPRLRR
ncbi:hypothetical protein ACLK2G_17555 [Escherichia coli]